MVHSPKLFDLRRPYIEASEEICKRHGENWLRRNGFTWDQLTDQETSVIFHLASVLVAVEEEVVNAATDQDQSRRWENWKSFLTNAETEPSLFPSDCCHSVDYCLNNASVERARFQSFVASVDQLLASNQSPLNKSNQSWQDWMVGLTGFLFHSLPVSLNFDPEHFSSTADALSFGRSLLDLPQLLNSKQSGTFLERGLCPFPKELTEQFQIPNPESFFDPAFVSEDHFALVRHVTTTAMSKLTAIDLEKHPEFFELDCFINFQQWVDITMDQLQFLYQNPEYYFQTR